MESSARLAAEKCDDDANAATTLNENENNLEQIEKVNFSEVSKDNAKLEQEVDFKSKRVTFHFNTDLSARRRDREGAKNPVLNTIQNLYEVAEENNNDNDDVRTSKINKSEYAKLNRHSYSTGTGNSTVDILKGKYERTTKQTDNDIKANADSRAKSNTDNNDSTNRQIETANEDRSFENLLLRTRSNIEKLQSNLSTKLCNDTIEKLRNKYSPASFGYPKSAKPTSKIPVPTPRASLQIERDAADAADVESVTVKSTTVPESDENSNSTSKRERDETYDAGVDLEVIYGEIEFAKPEAKHFIVRKSSSEDSVDRVESFFSEIIMDKKPKEKKRNNSFRKILTAGFFGKDKKKPDEDKVKHHHKKKDNAVFADNAQNESQAFDRSSSHRHTVDNSFARKDLQKNGYQSTSSGPLYYYPSQAQFRRTPDNVGNRYTEMKGDKVLNKYSPEEYVPMDNGNPTKSADNIQMNYMNVNKYIDTSSSSSNTLDSDLNRNCTYQNALVAQAEMRQYKENGKISGIPITANKKKSTDFQENNVCASATYANALDFRETSPRSSNTAKHLQLVKPKALIPINSERPLPNPYRNVQNKVDNSDLDLSKTIDRNLNCATSKPYPHKNKFNNQTNGFRNKPDGGPVAVVVEDVYGTVFDSISPPRSAQNSTSNVSSESNSSKCKSPTSPRSLESSKLKLPTNREKIELQPRIRSPLPQIKVSTDKIIATELLRGKRSPVGTGTPPSSRGEPRPSSYQGANVYENGSENFGSAAPISTSTPVHGVPQTASNEYIYLKALPPAPKHKPPISPSRETSSAADCLQAAEWQRKQRELDKSPALETQQIVTNVVVHANPDDARARPTNHGMQQFFFSDHNRQMSPRNSISTSNVRPYTPVQQRSSPSPTAKSSPDKQHMLQNVEAFYWRELKKLKEKEEQDLQLYRQHQLNVYGYVEDPVFIRRSRSVSPGLQRGRRSLSLPRDVKPIPSASGARPQIMGQEPIPEGRPVIAKKPIALPESVYGQLQQPFQRNPNFIRNTFERSTIGPIGADMNFRSLYENYRPAGGNMPGTRQAPIFKRGSLTSAAVPDAQSQMYKKVSFSNTQNPNNQASWPTKNGYTRSPPTRRIEREFSYDDEVFLPGPSDVADPIYVTRRRVDGDYPRRLPKRDYVLQQPHLAPKHVTVSNKVCDIYGQIHDPTRRTARVPDGNEASQNYGQIRQVGLMYGQLQQDPTSSNSIVHHHQSYNHLSAPPQTNFVRGTRLTASANDMDRRYPGENPRQQPVPRYRTDAIYANENYATTTSSAPYRPLPPLPERKDSREVFARKYLRGHVPVSDTESGSEAGEVQRILQSGAKQNNINVIEEEWNSDGKSGRASGNESGGSRGENEGEIKSSRSRSARREDPRRHTLSGDQHYGMAGQGGPLSRTMDLEFYLQGQFPRGYPPSSNAMLFDDDPGIMSEVETSSTGFRRGGKQRSSLPVVRTPSKTLERPLVFLQYRNETKRALLPNEITSIDTVKALFVRSFPKQLSMEYLDSPLVKIYIHDSSKDMFYELEDVRSHLREIRDRSVLRLFESTDVSGGLPMGGVGIPGGVGHFEDPSYFSEPEFDSEYQHQHIHKSKGSTSKAAPYYMGSTTSLPRSGPLLRPYSPAVGTLPPDRLKTLPSGAPPKPQRAYSSGATRASDASSRPPDRFAPFQRPANPLFNLPDGYMSSPERGSRGYEDPYYSQYTSRSGSITPVIDEEVSDTELLDEQYSLYGVKLAPGGPRSVRSQFPGPSAQPYDTTRLRVEHMERQLANLTGLVQKALTQTPPTRDFLAPPGRDSYRPDDSYLRSDSNKAPKLGKSSCHKSVSFEKSVSFSDEPPDMNSPKQHSPQHAEKDRLKPAPPPKPASLSPGQYDGRHIYRDLQLTPEMYNQLRGLQKKAKDLRAEVRNLRRMSQAQAHSVRETIRDTFIKIRAMLMAGGEQVWQAGMDQERVRLSREEDLYKQEMLRLEKDLTDLESSVEELRGNVINRKTRVNMSDVENMALVLSKSSKTVADLKLRFPGLQDSMKSFLSSEMDKVVREEKFLKEEPERLESALRRCKKLTGTLVTLKRLASVQEQRLPCSASAADGRISPSITETPPVTPTTGQHSKPPTGSRMGQVGFGGDNTNAADGNQRPENALDALLDELQTFSKPHSTTVNTQMPQASYSDSTPSDPPAIPIKGIPPSHSAHFGHPHMSEIGRKGSMDSASLLPTQNLTVSTATGSLRRLHSYPSGSDTDNSPPIQPLRSQLDSKPYNKPPIPERNAELLQHITSGRRVPPPPPPRTSSKSPLASPTSPSLPPRSPATGLQHIQNVQNMSEKPQSQFEAATQNLGLSTLRRNVPNRSSIKDNKAQTLPRNIGSNLQVHNTPTTTGSELQNVSSSSCESVNSQDGTKKGSRKEELEQRHQELLKKQKALQEQYARLQQLQRGNNTLAVIPPAPDQLLKKTGSESNLLQKMGLQMATAQMTGSLTHLPSTTANSTSTIGNNVTNTSTNSNMNTPPPPSTAVADVNVTDNSSSSSTTTTSKVYETDIL